MALKMFQKKEEAAPLSSVSYLIAIAAGKGGVGKSSLTVNLALSLRAAGYSVGIMDTDLYGPSIRRMLPEEKMPAQKGEKLVPAVCYNGIRMISMAYFRKENEATAVRAPIANGLIAQFIKNVDWGVLDFLLIDFPPGTGDIQLTLSQQANLTGAILITTPQEVAIMDVRKAAHLFEQVKVPIVGIVENMSYFFDPIRQEKVYLFGQGGGERLAQEIGIPLLGKIPIDPEISQCGDEGQPLIRLGCESHSSAASSFIELSKNFVAHLNALQRTTQEGLESFEVQWKQFE